MEIKSNVVESKAVKLSVMDGEKEAGWAYLFLIANDRHKESYGYLENVYVHPEYRSQGLGKKLVYGIFDEAKKHGCYKIVATSRYSKPDVHAMYERYGFKDHGKNFRIDLIDSKVLQAD
ncbi:TPA: GNAT family N-acetyltransferase [candidate division CPR2 bacterium]|uniref:GCN5-related N-acetyltransferase n=1 Tax=candidate division CPR2 bacterium GW2011_GWC1_41_48 TaxID=1618344 RepID=A0A0G0W9S4_UNCC2|nr:MAG: GCN5-related N-acetyltransferase [candidate division CPR2 bacterium GW2011_GWC2_39_35]KKR28565.1 MAG: GCN5-related N-acetyltransferase [candidate division CPR2 bacterium GW2011_GWD1_39_7]KKR29420.1 MAG: GCN5-related N-acetyltransferase [candidate division CPR2 bacterium GW2011_GWD2_39_7]KKS09749.1 MAG: GCN5-related N-acetyltransferase [candidate division CPR2 bacterium GW2011_GWC1_41_48]OGB61010.1 MAG: hypothetical protein A2Y27_02920 [candidate division CPR2 bacterium GWD1_39_7]OGB712